MSRCDTLRVRGSYHRQHPIGVPMMAVMKEQPITQCAEEWYPTKVVTPRYVHYLGVRAKVPVLRGAPLTTLLICVDVTTLWYHGSRGPYPKGTSTSSYN